MTALTRALGLLWLLTVASGASARVKLIELGWDIPDTAFLRGHWRQMEAEAPFDGLVLRVAANDDQGHRIGSEGIWQPAPWQRAWFSAARDDLRACGFKRFTSNFIRINATPTALGWTDDAAWQALATNVGTMAWLAREGGCVGLCFDFEPYGQNQWQWDPASGKSFVETAVLARRRGEQVARAVAQELPRAVLLTLFANSQNHPAGRAVDPQVLLAKEPYGLLPAFFEGLLAASTPDMTLVDGCEGGYYYDRVATYQRVALDMKAWQGPSAALIEPALRPRFREQVQAGFGIYLDMFINPEGHTYYRGPLEGSRLRHLTRNLAAARDAADEYVWVYGEQCRWWSGLAPWREAELKDTAGRGRGWEEALPGITRAIDRVRDLDGAAQAEVAAALAAGTARNLLANPDFTQGPPAAGAQPTGWAAWQHEKEPTGTFAWDAAVGGGSARATHVTWGCYLQDYEAPPGSQHRVRARCRLLGSGTPTLTLRWQTAGRRWTNEGDDRTFAFRPDTDGWLVAQGVVTVPEGAGRLVVLLDIRGQRDDQSSVWFDDVSAYRLAD